MALESVEKVNQRESMPISQRVLRYYLHGFLWSVLLTVIAIGGVVILGPMVLIGSFLGLILVLILIFYAMGYLNKALTSFLWDEYINSNWMSLLFHGFLLFLVLLFLHLPVGVVVIVLSSTMPPILESILPMLLVYPFIDGFIAKAIGDTFVVEPDKERRYFPKIAHPDSGRPVERESLKECPYCQNLFPYKEENIAEDGTVTCRHCGSTIRDPRYP
ncbi:hypothetical protein EU537_03035 [Candidatus Thorarchaeota archaeon]|nr:MAG: hypothetical protein EU537_03035 [Candidatus Thorarchaeota archaeon]